MNGFSVPFLLFLLSTTVSGLGSVVSKYYTHIDGYFTWKEAQNYCQSFYTDLATIYTQTDVSGLLLQQYHVWIGLHKKGGVHPTPWVWSDGESYNLTTWESQPSDASERCAAVNSVNKRISREKCTFYFFFLCHKTEGNHRSYTFIPQSKTWSEAQEYCRTNDLYLAGLTVSDLNTAVSLQDFPIWIGLHRDGGTWTWSTSTSDYTNWKSGEPGNHGDCVSVSSVEKEMAAQNCDDRFPFICISENVILVNENKTWEEALEYCRALSSPDRAYLRFDLLSVQPGDEHDYVMSKVRGANTEEVWTGLRFLAGEWLWVNGADMLYSDLPVCPMWGQHCGALCKTNADSVKPRDCLERKGFLCYSTFET